MEKMVLKIFQKEIHRQCEFALTSAMYINDTIKNLDDVNATNQLWYFTQNFLIATANVSKILWGSKDKISLSRLPLRKSLNVKDDSMIRSRALRNDFEHFDERVETWSTESTRKNFVDSNVGSAGMIIGVDQDDYFRNFDPDKMVVTFKGKIYEFQPIVDELVELHKIAEHESKKPSWK
ncbi:hypothetical protein [Bacillus luti]|uniref:hypothetical protein n=1 Tax=Bacillus luti TaxID=2026191 RepID=UPI0028A2296B|nr:hypothetical protein [Bacillus luti]